MANVYEVIEQLCSERGITGGKLCNDLGISRSTITELRKGRNQTLKLEKAVLIANYFGVSVEYLLGTEQKENAPTLTEKDECDIARNVEKIMSQLDSGGDLMFDGNPMSEEAIESMRAAMKLGLEAAKMKNKERFTPKKYRGE